MKNVLKVVGVLLVISSLSGCFWPGYYHGGHGGGGGYHGGGGYNGGGGYGPRP